MSRGRCLTPTQRLFIIKADEVEAAIRNVVVNKVIFDGHVHDNQLMELFLTNYIIDP
jgi:hypothetical protein